ncbi:hypothetical protein CR513_35475, partial [Mucuna pruriens]
MNQKGKFNKACRKSYLEIKCKDKTCSCSSKKKKREVQPLKKRRKSFKFFRKKKIRGKTFDQRCFICGKKGHYSRNCPNKADKAIKLISSLKLGDEEVESLYSEQSSANEETVFALKESEDEDQSEADSIPIFSIEKLNSITIFPPQLCVEVQLLPSKFQKPIKVIDYMDTEAQKTMMNPDILPKEFWKKEICYFVAADRKVFKTDLITKDPVGIRFFPECVVWSRVIGSKLPDKDILIGMDIYSAANKLQILSTGVRYKKEVKPFTEALKLFSLTEAHAEIEEIKKKNVLFIHEEFTHPNPIWKNPDFFIRLPFKLNEDVNPTKATHPGMTPSDLLLARQECHELLRQGLIEPTQSNWACQAFYVEKRSEKLRGKKRLVIDYKPLNHFLQDDKFPIPKASSLPVLLKESNIFSKFDLKSGFWQLGIDLADRHKTTFCIPNAQYQWTVLPFGLKVAPSLFQKVMTRIFEPLLEHAIIYIDDILLFSRNMETHKALLNQFFDIANQYGLMFSEKKIHLAQSEIDFLGMHFSQGSYQPQPHIAEELLKFPDQSLIVKQIQQFLRIVNYIRDFIPHVARYTSPLSKLLKKDPPPWGPEQTQAIQELKKIAQSPPALKIPGEEKHILQTDASDFYWGAVLIEELENKKFYCGHASGQFKEAERHYHTTFKEALAVKNGIKKFDFHLRRHHFEVQMDNSSFPKILEFKNKISPDPQILRLKDWLSRYDFSVKHIKGKQNLIPDLLSRPGKIVQMIITTHSFPLIFMVKPLSNKKPRLARFSLEYPNGQIWSNNVAYFWGTFEDYPLDESYKLQLSQHLREINSTGTSSQTTVNPYPFDRLIPSSSNTQEIKLFKSTTEYYMPEERFQRVENLYDQADNQL